MEGIYFTGGRSQHLFGSATVFLARSYFPHLLQPVTKHGGGTRTDVALFQWAPLGQGFLGGLAKLSRNSCHQRLSPPLYPSLTFSQEVSCMSNSDLVCILRHPN